VTPPHEPDLPDGARDVSGVAADGTTHGARTPVDVSPLDDVERKAHNLWSKLLSYREPGFGTRGNLRSSHSNRERLMDDMKTAASLIDVVDRVQLTLDRIQGVAAVAGRYVEMEVKDGDLAKSVYLCGGLAKELDGFVTDWWESERRKSKRRKERKTHGTTAYQERSTASLDYPRRLHDGKPPP
jgi:hypothetical protein